VPDENPITESKRVLGKILFLDEWLSSDGVMGYNSAPIQCQLANDRARGLLSALLRGFSLSMPFYTSLVSYRYS
jgi:hypothetical protein